MIVLLTEIILGALAFATLTAYVITLSVLGIALVWLLITSAIRAAVGHLARLWKRTSDLLLPGQRARGVKPSFHLLREGAQ